MSLQPKLKICQSALHPCDRRLEMIWGADSSNSAWLLGCCSWACVEAEHYGKENMVEQACSLHGDHETEIKRGKGRAGY